MPIFLNNSYFFHQQQHLFWPQTANLNKRKKCRKKYWRSSNKKHEICVCNQDYRGSSTIYNI